MGIIFDYIFWTVTWFGITGLVRYVAEIPPSLRKIDNVKLQRKQYYQYFTNLVSLIHAFYALAICRIDIIRRLLHTFRASSMEQAFDCTGISAHQ
jgi:hypothetical protein